MKIITNSIVTILIIFSLLFSSFFYLESKEQYDYMDQNSFFSFFIGKIILNLKVIFFYLTTAYLLHKFIIKIKLKKKNLLKI